jgi:membrane protease YdiL (CAAX protease family)
VRPLESPEAGHPGPAAAAVGCGQDDGPSANEPLSAWPPRAVLPPQWPPEASAAQQPGSPPQWPPPASTAPPPGGPAPWPVVGPSSFGWPDGTAPAPSRLRANGGPASRGPERDAPAGLQGRALWLVLPGGLAAVVLASVGSGVGDALSGSATSALTLLLGELGLWAGMLGTAVVASKRYGSSSLRRDYGLAFRRVDALWGLLTLAAALALSEVALAAFSGTKFAGSNDQIITQQEGHKVGLVVVALVVALGAPFFEELFFRGYLRTALQPGVGTHLAVLIQAVFFGLAHVGEAKGLGNVSVGIAMACVGVVLGYAARLTRRLGAGMLAHGLFNLLAVVVVVA